MEAVSKRYNVCMENNEQQSGLDIIKLSIVFLVAGLSAIYLYLELKDIEIQYSLLLSNLSHESSRAVLNDNEEGEQEEPEQVGDYRVNYIQAQEEGTYVDQEHRFEILHPSGWTLTVADHDREPLVYISEDRMPESPYDDTNNNFVLVAPRSMDGIYNIAPGSGPEIVQEDVTSVSAGTNTVWSLLDGQTFAYLAENLPAHPDPWDQEGVVYGRVRVDGIEFQGIDSETDTPPGYTGQVEQEDVEMIERIMSSFRWIE